ncbi:1-phosphofructokinase family hexose kinase [Streptomyces sp. NBC_01775]|uniref:1-phosphofructokinase family hexose kinase n=1 Tax=Streptomyces sp. NBC_01775 TaxID=2975939 RepID=UPI002DD87EF2|nr:1-phosphofructokinase family hexose kinase [Streptomyces sp. NBC_01775]WSB76554.1 1-phosphofructokinase family hexose kinase [Streptomyces sp. NBC_01775]
MIVTLTPNPSIDRTLTVPEYVPGEVNRSAPCGLEPSGKGINVSLALHAQHRPTRAVLPLGGPDGAVLAQMLDQAGLEFTGVPVEGPVRSNVTIVEAGGRVTKVNEPGPELSSDETVALLEGTAKAAQDAGWLLAAGSLPRGVAPDFYARLLDGVRGSGAVARVAVDSSGPALATAIRRSPDLIKPNVHELAEAAGAVGAPASVRTLGDALDAARRLQDAGAGTVLASLGVDGVLLVEREAEAVHAEARVLRPQNTVGAGDALLAGFLGAGGAGPDALREALRWASGAIMRAGTLLGAHIDDAGFALRVHDEVDRRRALTLD